MKYLAAAILAALVGVIVVGIVIITQLNAAEEAEDHARIVRLCEATGASGFELADCIIQLKGDR